MFFETYFYLYFPRFHLCYYFSFASPIINPDDSSNSVSEYVYFSLLHICIHFLFVDSICEHFLLRHFWAPVFLSEKYLRKCFLLKVTLSLSWFFYIFIYFEIFVMIHVHHLMSHFCWKAYVLDHEIFYATSKEYLCCCFLYFVSV